MIITFIDHDDDNWIRTLLLLLLVFISFPFLERRRKKKKEMAYLKRKYRNAI